MGLLDGKLVAKVAQPMRLAVVSLLVFLLGFGAIVLHRRGQWPALFGGSSPSEPATPSADSAPIDQRYGPTFKSATFASESEIFRLEKRGFSFEPELFSNNTRKFIDIPASLSDKRISGIGGLPTEGDPSEASAQLQGYRSGLIEINETTEFSNKITLSTIDWKVSPLPDRPGLVLAQGVTTIAPHPPFFVSVLVNQRRGGFLREILITRKEANPEAGKDKKLLFSALELRSTDQKRGAPITKGLMADQASAIGYQAERIDEQGATDVAVLFRNSQWLDIPMRKGQKKYLVSIELPDFSALSAP